MRSRWRRRLVRSGLVAVAMAGPTWLLFGPVGGFHHQILFGLLGYMFWNGEDPGAGGFMFCGEYYRAGISATRLGLTVDLWLACLWAAAAAVRRFTGVRDG